MADRDNDTVGLSGKEQERRDASSTASMTKEEAADVNEQNALGNVTTPEGDSDGENRVTTSLSDD